MRAKPVGFRGRLFRFALPFLLVLATAGTSAAQPTPLSATSPAQQENGVALEISMATVLSQFGGLSGGQNAIVNFGLLKGGIFGGYKLDRFIFGLGFDIARTATSTSVPGSDSSNASTAIVLIPGVRVAILRSSDQRVELFGQFDIGWGHTFTSQSPAPVQPQPDTSNNSVIYQLGPGLRYWIHPQFALALLAALRGEFRFNSMTQNNVTTSNSTGITTIMAALGFTGVF